MTERKCGGKFILIKRPHACGDKYTTVLGQVAVGQDVNYLRAVAVQRLRDAKMAVVCN